MLRQLSSSQDNGQSTYEGGGVQYVMKTAQYIPKFYI